MYFMLLASSRKKKEFKSAYFLQISILATNLFVHGSAGSSYVGVVLVAYTFQKKEEVG